MTASTTVLDYEHEVLARLIGNAALVAHGGDCELCSRLGVRRHLDDLAERIRAVNDTPHPAPKPVPKPAPPAPPKPGGK